MNPAWHTLQTSLILDMYKEIEHKIKTRSHTQEAKQRAPKAYSVLAK